jgi:hypothetical protein
MRRYARDPPYSILKHVHISILYLYPHPLNGGGRSESSASLVVADPCYRWIVSNSDHCQWLTWSTSI